MNSKKLKISCRYCWENDDNLLSPCRCKGHIKYVHKKCLLKWIDSKRENFNNSYECEICKTRYNIKSGKNLKISNLQYILLNIFILFCCCPILGWLMQLNSNTKHLFAYEEKVWYNIMVNGYWMTTLLLCIELWELFSIYDILDRVVKRLKTIIDIRPYNEAE